MSDEDYNKNITIILNKIKKNNNVFLGQNINAKIADLIKNNGSINYEDYDYQCSYKTEVYGSSGAIFEIDKIHKVPK